MSQEIEISKLKIHPKNVRKSYQGIEELADSIRTKGILQNLTVVPDPDEEGTYFVVIGNRRLTAARLAGIETAPCIIAEMDEKEQAETMLLENILRDNLTIYEQAQGFQMVLDLGETEEGLAEKTGFSKTTIRRRLNIAKLDQDVLQEREHDGEFQLSLTDLYELEKIKDVKKRNDILENARDSRDISFRVRNIVAEEKREKNAKKIIAMLKKAGIEAAPEKAEQEIYSNKWVTLKTYGLEDELPKSIDVEAEEKEQLYYLKYWRDVRIIRKAKKQKKELTPEEKRRAEKDSRKKKVKAIVKDMTITRKDFIRDIIAGKVKPLKDTEEREACRSLWKVMRNGNSYITNRSFLKFLAGKDAYEMSETEKQEFTEQMENLEVIEQELIAAHEAIDSLELMDWQAKFNEEQARIYKALYDVLALYGFSLNTSEAQLLDGTHELYTEAEIEDE